MQVAAALRGGGGGGCLEGSKEGSWVGREAGGGSSSRAQDRQMHETFQCFNNRHPVEQKQALRGDASC